LVFLNLKYHGFFGGEPIDIMRIWVLPQTLKYLPKQRYNFIKITTFWQNLKSFRDSPGMYTI